MDRASPKFGLSAALATPFDASGAIDRASLVKHARRCLSDGCDSLTLFGTTGEGASIGYQERSYVLDALKAADISGRKLVAGISAVSVEDALKQIRQAEAYDCQAVLLPPPFYFKDVSDDGLHDWFSLVLDQCPDDGLQIILYSIPSQTGISLSPKLIGKIRAAFPKQVVGVKDSVCDWAYTEKLLDAHRDLTILIGDERLLARAVQQGAQGSICGLANFIPGRVKAVIQSSTEDDYVNQVVDALVDYPILAAIKAATAVTFNEPVWRTMRPPLTSLGQSETAQLSRQLTDIGLAA